MQKKPTQAASEYPMRINKYLAKQGISTRRGADELVARGKVHINGRVAKMGEKVVESDKVEIVGKQDTKKLIYLAYNKPRGVITHSPQEGEKEIKNIVPLDVFPIGRLDKDSSGLIILTNDGRITDRLLNPDYAHEKEYRVRTLDPIRDGFKRAIEPGIMIEGYKTKPCTVRKTGPNSFVITLTEGKKHQIRRMASAVHNVVTELERTRILNVRLENLKPGAWRAIEGKELEELLALLGLK